MTMLVVALAALAVQAADQEVTTFHNQPTAPETATESTVQPVPQAAPAPQQQPLMLTCGGAGTANKATSSTAWSSGQFSGHGGTTHVGGTTSGHTTIMGMRQQGFADQVDVRLFDGDDRIRMPRTMLPLIRGGKEGWFKLKNIQVEARAIRASAAVSIINNPKVYIDRVTGTISISGKSGDYSGQCEVVPPDAPAKF